MKTCTSEEELKIDRKTLSFKADATLKVDLNHHSSIETQMYPKKLILMLTVSKRQATNLEGTSLKIINSQMIIEDNRSLKHRPPRNLETVERKCHIGDKLIKMIIQI